MATLILPLAQNVTHSWMRHSDHSCTVTGKRYGVNTLFAYVCASVPIGQALGAGGGVSQKLPIAPHPSPMLGTHMDSDRLVKDERREPEREDGGMPACLPPGTQMILTACLLHPLCADPFKHYQLKTDPGLPPL